MEIERYYAIREGARNAAQDHYFDARKAIDTPDNRSTFCAGFDRGYDAREAEIKNATPGIFESTCID